MMERVMDTILQDKKLICCDCGAQFTFNAGEQAYFKSKQLSQPKRCPRCRERRRNSIVPDVNGGEL